MSHMKLATSIVTILVFLAVFIAGYILLQRRRARLAEQRNKARNEEPNRPKIRHINFNIEGANQANEEINITTPTAPYADVAGNVLPPAYNDVVSK